MDNSPGFFRFGKPIAAVFVLLVIAVGWGVYHFAFTPNEPHRKDKTGAFDKQDKPVAVALETAQQGDLPIYLSGLGTVTPLKTVTVRSRVDGEIVRLLFKEGQQVKAGDLLAEIDPRPFDVQVQQAQGQLLKDQALLTNAEQDLQRYQTLLEQDSIAEQQTKTQASLVQQYRGTVAVDQAQLNNAKLQRSYAQITAPISGQVGLRQVDQGNIIRASDTNGLVVITQLQPVSVLFTLPEDQVQAVIRRWHQQPDLAVNALDRSGQQKLADGRLDAVDNQIDVSTGTLKLRALFENRDGLLFANQFVNVRLLLDTQRNTVTVSNAAIQHDNEGAFVFVVGDEQKALLRRIRTGATTEARTAVLEHLAAGEKVVVAGIDRLKDGSAVQISQLDGQSVALPASESDSTAKADRRKPKP